MSDETLLPNNFTPWELAHSLTNAARRPLPHHLLKLLWNPEKVPAGILPYLANALSVDLWFEDWDEQRKRKIVADSFNLHRLKGRVEAVRRHLPYVDATLLKATTPPSKTFLMPALTNDERAEFLARFAQLRIRRFVAVTNNRFGFHTTAAYGFSKAFMGVMHLWNAGARDRYRARAYLWDGGAEKELTLREIVKEDTDGTAVATQEIVLPATGERKAFVGGFLNEVHFGNPADTRQKIISIGREVARWAPRELYRMINPGPLINVRPEYVAQKHPRQTGSLFFGDYIGRQKLTPSVAWRYLYERWHIHDPARVPESRKRSTHLGATRLGMPSYWAEYQVAVRGKRERREIGKYMSGFLRAPNGEPLRRALMAVRTASALRDKALVNTITRRVIVAGDMRRVGQAAVGELTET